MPLELITDGPGSVALREYQDPELKPGQVRIRSILSSIKHGTEFRRFRDQDVNTGADTLWDKELLLHRRDTQIPERFPRPLGNMVYGVVTDSGGGYESANQIVGAYVIGFRPLRETHVMNALAFNNPHSSSPSFDGFYPAPSGVSPRSLMFLDPLTFALGAVRDGNVRLGDSVLVVGMGAIGQMAAQCAHLAGARFIVVSDKHETRLNGATDVFLEMGGSAFEKFLYVRAETTEDMGIRVKTHIKSVTQQIGVDVAFETTGSPSGLDAAVRSVRYGGTVVSMTRYSGDMRGLFLAGEWHLNRVRLISSRAQSDPGLDYGWNFERTRTEALALISSGQVFCHRLLKPIVVFSEVVPAYQRASRSSAGSIKLGVSHGKDII